MSAERTSGRDRQNRRKAHKRRETRADTRTRENRSSASNNEKERGKIAKSSVINNDTY